jgi:hypothetical protein
MAKIDTNYQMRKGESADAYNTRVAEYNASNGGGKTESSGGNYDALLSRLTKMSETQAEAISSGTTNIESSIKRAISGIESSTESGAARIESEYARERGYSEDRAKTNLTQFRESQSGFGTQMVALRNLVKTTDSELKDLQMRKEELLMANDSAGASKIAELEMKALEYREQAKQQVFNNILQIGAFGLQLKAEQRAGQEFKANFDLQLEKLELEKDIAQKNSFAQMAQLASQYGVTVEENDTIQSIATKVAPIASKEVNARLNNLLLENQRIQSSMAEQGAQLQIQSGIAKYMTEDSADVYTAVGKVMADLGAMGIEVTPEMYNKAETSAQEMKRALETQTQGNVSNMAPGYWEQVMSGIEGDTSFGSIPARAVAIPGKLFEGWKGLVGF